MARSAPSARAVSRGGIQLATGGGADGRSVRARPWPVCFVRAIVEYLTANDNLGYAVSVVRNPEWHRGNGISVHLAGTVLAPDEEVLLSMSDHLVSPAALREMIDADDFEAVPIPAASHWIDIDTPAAYEHATANRARYG